MKNAMQLKAIIKNIAKEKHISAQLVMQNFMLERLLERISVQTSFGGQKYFGVCLQFRNNNGREVGNGNIQRRSKHKTKRLLRYIHIG